MADATTPPSDHPAKPPQNKHRLPYYISRFDHTIAHANRQAPSPPPTPSLAIPNHHLTGNPSHSLLSTTTGLDTTLLTLNYTLVLLHAQLSALSPTRRLPTTASAPRLLPSLHALASLISDVRVFLRLWGLLGIWAWGVRVWRTPPTDAVLRRLAWAQVAVNAAYQVLENGAYLAQHGVLRMGERRQARWWVWSSRFWMAHVVLDLGRLVRVRGLALRKREEGDGEEKEGKVRREREREVEGWWREVYVNVAYAPLTVHWSLERGCVSEAWVGFLGMVAGVVGLRGLWEETA